MARTLAALLMVVFWSGASWGDAALPPRLELQKLSTVYIDCRALVGEQGQPGLLETPEISDRIRPSVFELLAKAGLSVSPKGFASDRSCASGFRSYETRRCPP